MLRQPPGQKRIGGVVRAFDAEQNAAESAIGGKQKIAARLGLKTGGVGKCARLGADRLPDVAIIHSRDEPDPNCGCRPLPFSMRDEKPVRPSYAPYPPPLPS